jgi:hypothetical protein
VLHALRTNAARLGHDLKERSKREPFFMTYDNWDISLRVRDERLHNKTILHHCTMAAVLFMKKQDGTLWSQRPSDQPKDSGIFGVEDDDERLDPRYPPPSQTWIRPQEMAEMTAGDILNVVWSCYVRHWHNVSKSVVCDVLWKVAGKEMGRKRKVGGQEVKLERIAAPEVHQITAAKMEAYPLPAMELNEATLEGNSAILDRILKEVGIEPEKLGGDKKWIIPLSGDQLTVARVRTLQFVREDSSESGKLKWLTTIAGMP